MRFVSVDDSARKRERMHFYPPDSPLSFRMYSSIAGSIIQNTIPKIMYLRSEDNYEILGPKQLCDIRSLPVEKRRLEVNALADRMYWAEEIIIEEANPERINIHNVPQVIFEPVEFVGPFEPAANSY